MLTFESNQRTMAARSGPRTDHGRQKLWLIPGVFIAIGVIAVWRLANGPADIHDPQPEQTSARYRQQLLTPENPAAVAQALPAARSTITRAKAVTPELIEETPDAVVWRAERIRPGDSFATIMQRLGYSPAVVVKVMNSGPRAQQLVHLQPDHQLNLLEHDGELQKLNYEIDRRTRLDIDLTTTPPNALTVNLPVDIRVQHSSGIINSSLYLSAQAAGLDDPLIMELANIFGWDVDFTLDLRTGDHFTVIYSELFLDGEKIDNGQIFAAELTANGRKFRAVRYENKAGKADYYAPNGRSMRKAFSRNPLPITRITSRFNPNRLHPIFKTRRPHRGVDYGAASGTPVRATGDGKITFRGQKSGYGNTVIIQHGQRYSTLYAHLKSFARSVKTGSSVKQGKTIAFVGQSGWATGPHLHYEFRVNGVHKNPLTVRLPPAKPINSGEKQRFLVEIGPYVDQLDTLVKQRLAKREQ